MKSKIFKIIILSVISILGISLLTLTPAVHAANDVCSSDAAEAVKEAAGCNGTNNALPGIITGILNTIIAISGIIAVIFVLIGGINYMTSAGDSSKVEKAKKTILYACIGLVIAALSFAIVNWAISAIANNSRQSSSSSQNEDSDEENNKSSDDD